MVKLDNFVDMMTGHFNNKEQFDKMKKEGKIYPYAEHINTICNGKILNFPKDFNGRFVVEESYYETNGKRHASPHLFLITEEEDKNIIENINKTKPDFVWIGLGAPKQEKWMAEHQGKIDGLMLGVGAGFDYYAENIKRAPMWMQKSNLEWLYRLMQDPKRLFKRYFHTNTKFIWNAMIRGK